MLEGHRKLVLKTTTNEDIEIEVNYSSNLEVQNCKIMRIRKGDQEFDVKRDDLVSIMLIIGDMETQKKMLPVKMERVRKLERMLHFDFVAKKDYKRGEKIYVSAPWIDVVPDVEEVFSGNVNKNKIIT